MSIVLLLCATQEIRYKIILLSTSFTWTWMEMCSTQWYHIKYIKCKSINKVNTESSKNHILVITHFNNTNFFIQSNLNSSILCTVWLLSIQLWHVLRFVVLKMANWNMFRIFFMFPSCLGIFWNLFFMQIKKSSGKKKKQLNGKAWQVYFKFKTWLSLSIFNKF